MMPLYLLTGAGFSRNWGGWLANEAFEYLLGCTDITPGVHRELWKSKNQGYGFENTLQELRSLAAKHKTEPFIGDLRAFEGMLLSMFNSMNNGFKKVDLEPSGAMPFAEASPQYATHFLCQFDAIFTLNQDCLLELKYMDKNIHKLSQGRFNSMYMPGVEPIQISGKPYEPPGLYKPGRKEAPLQQFRQPYFKLHGSSNFRSEDDSAILIMGGNKGPDIEKVYLLRYYRGHFEQMICRKDARLMVIGYSFTDPHINEIILKAAGAGAKLFIVDVRGIDVLAVQEPTNNAFSLMNRLSGSLLGGSRRDLVTTFSTDSVERDKLMKFLVRLD